MRILHISDLHFSLLGDGERSEKARDALMSFLGEERKISKIIVTGDFQHCRHINAYRRTRSDIEHAMRKNLKRILSFLDDIRAICGLGYEDVMLVPGNHDCSSDKIYEDVVDAALKSYDREEGAFSIEFADQLNERFEFFWDLCSQFYTHLGNDYPWSEKNANLPYVTKFDPHTGVILLNSAMVSFARKGRPPILYGRNNIRKAILKLTNDNREIRRILLCAHNSIQDMSRDELPQFLKIFKEYNDRELTFYYLCGDAHSPHNEQRDGVYEYRAGCIGGEQGNNLAFNIYTIAGDTFFFDEYKYNNDFSSAASWFGMPKKNIDISLKEKSEEYYKQISSSNGRYSLHFSQSHSSDLSKYIQNSIGQTLKKAIKNNKRFLNVIGESGSGKTTALLKRWESSFRGQSNRISLFVPMYLINSEYSINSFIETTYCVSFGSLRSLANEIEVEILLDAINESDVLIDEVIYFVEQIKSSNIRLVVTSTLNPFIHTKAHDWFTNFKIVVFSEKSCTEILGSDNERCHPLSFLDNVMHVSWYIDTCMLKEERESRLKEHGIAIAFEEQNNPIALFVNQLKNKICDYLIKSFTTENIKEGFSAFVDLFWISPMVCHQCTSHGKFRLTGEAAAAIEHFLKNNHFIIIDHFKHLFSMYVDESNFSASELLSLWMNKSIFFVKSPTHEYVIDPKYIEYFQAIHIANSLLLSSQDNRIAKDIDTVLLSIRIIRLTLYRIEHDDYKLIRNSLYSTSTIQNFFHNLITLLRNVKIDVHPYALANIISLMRERSIKMSCVPNIENTDFSGLDFTNSKLNGIHFNNCDFSNSTITRESIAPQGHSGDISSICFLNHHGVDEKYFISGSYDSDIRIWNIENGNCVSSLTCSPHSFIQHISLSEDGSKLAVALRSGFVNLYHISSDLKLSCFFSRQLHNAPIWSVWFDKSGLRILSGSEDKTVKVFNRITNRFEFECNIDDEVLFATYNNSCNKILVCSRNSTIYEFSTKHSSANNGLLWTHRHHDVATGIYTCIAYDPYDSNKFYSCGENGRITSWVDHKPIMNFVDETIDNGRKEQRAHTGWIYSIHCLKNRKLLVSSSFDGSAKVWDTGDNSLYRTYPDANDGSSLRCAVADDGGNSLVVGSVNGHITSRDINNVGEIIQYPGQNRSLINISLSPDGTKLLSPGENFCIQEYIIEASDANSYEYHRSEGEFSGHKDSVIYSEYSTDGRYIVSSSYDFSVRLWDNVNRGKPIWKRMHNNAAMSARFNREDPYCVLSASYDETAIEWKIDGTEIFKFKNPNGRSLRTAIYSRLCDNDNKIIVGDFGGRIVEVDRNPPHKEGPIYQHNDFGIIMSMDLTYDGKTLLSASDRNFLIEWDRSTSNEKYRYDCRSSIFSVKYSKDNCFILASLFSGELWEWKRGETSAPIYIYRGHTKPSTYAVYNFDGSKILSTSYDGTIREWLRPGEENLQTEVVQSKCIATIISGLHYHDCKFENTYFDSCETKKLIVK